MTIQLAFENMAFLAQEKQIQQSVQINKKLLPFLKNINADEGRYT